MTAPSKLTNFVKDRFKLALLLPAIIAVAVLALALQSGQETRSVSAQTPPLPVCSHVGPVLWNTGAGHTNHTYEIVCASQMSWTSARSAATAAGGYLVTITSANENAFLMSLLTGDAHKAGLWAGGFQEPLPCPSEPAGCWRWVTATSGQEPWVYTNWYCDPNVNQSLCPTEPNNTDIPSGPEDYIVFNWADGFGTWNDTGNNSLYSQQGKEKDGPFGYIIEREPDPTPTRTVTPTSTIPQGGPTLTPTPTSTTLLPTSTGTLVSQTSPLRSETLSAPPTGDAGITKNHNTEYALYALIIGLLAAPTVGLVVAKARSK